MPFRQHGRRTLVPRIQYGDSTVPLSKDAVIAAPIVAVVMLLVVAISWFAWRRCVKNQKPPVRFEPRRLEAPVYRPPEGRENDPDLPPYSPNELPAYERDVDGAGDPAQPSTEMPQQEGIELQDVSSSTQAHSHTATEADGTTSQARSSPSDAGNTSPQPTRDTSEHHDLRRPDQAHIVHTS